ncbi:hypothetical protein F4821DRAFT_275307 [Hypoxylon rubiginosum]|uniref:Uncharacterized protein n=1 Tax=Hypoxylon rubiginosum TaxID=110542 RepID=A0ACC0DBU4_9PEZI|nr:hypothetical protein F4821DRAFT_275307 [Hypoxylon rubiginosum]
MCQGVCWDYRCRRCGTLVYKDTFVPGTKDLAGHMCKRARRSGVRGCCRTGIEWQFPQRLAEELCVMCELSIELDVLDASTCDEAARERRYADSDDEDVLVGEVDEVEVEVKSQVESKVEVKVEDVKTETKAETTTETTSQTTTETKHEDKVDEVDGNVESTKHDDKKVDDSTEYQDEDGGAPLKIDQEEKNEAKEVEATEKKGNGGTEVKREKKTKATTTTKRTVGILRLRFDAPPPAAVKVGS